MYDKNNINHPKTALTKSTKCNTSPNLMATVQGEHDLSWPGWCQKLNPTQYNRFIKF